MSDEEVKEKFIYLKENDREGYNEVFDGYCIIKNEKRAIELGFGLSDGIEHTLDEIDEIMYKEMHNNRSLKELKKDKEKVSEFCSIMGVEIDTTPAVGRQFLAKGIRKLKYYFR